MTVDPDESDLFAIKNRCCRIGRAEIKPYSYMPQLTISRDIIYTYMFIRNFLLCTVTALLISCATIPDISRSYGADSGPWLTLNGDPRESITINWLTAGSESSYLLFGEDPENLDEIRTEGKKTKLHSIDIGDLRAGTDYYYSLDGELVYSFATAPEIDRPVRFTVVGDLQPFQVETDYNNDIVSKELAKLEYDLTIQLGDLSESGGLNFLWEKTFKYISRYASSKPIVAAPGNHDYYGKGKWNFRKLFPYEYPSRSELYHSMDYGPASLIFLDFHTENPDIGKNQLIWLEEELAKSQRNKKWTFVFFHGTLISSETGTFDEQAHRSLIPLFDRYSVDAVFFGHTHMYEHWHYTYGQGGLIHNETDVPAGKAIHYFLSGGGGGSLRYFRLFERDERLISSDWINRDTGELQNISSHSRVWNPGHFIDHSENPEYGAPPHGLHYYHLPEEQSYWGYNNFLGYQYGEKTLHYMSIDISGENHETCTISAHYPNGDLLSGPGGLYPQKWVIKKGEAD